MATGHEAELTRVREDIKDAEKDLSRAMKRRRKEGDKDERNDLLDHAQHLRATLGQLREKELILLRQGTAGAEGADVDKSREYAADLIKPVREAPPALDELRKFLVKPPDAKIPILKASLDLANLPTHLGAYFKVVNSGRLAHAVGMSMAAPLTQGASELWTAIAEHTVVVSLLLELDNVLPGDLAIGLVAERDQADATSLMTVKSAGGSSLWPDGVLRESGTPRLLAKWENKGATMGAAVLYLRKKTKAWTQLYYGDIEYLPCFAAAGSKLQFYAISRAGGLAAAPRAVSPLYDLAKPEDRARAVMATIKFYQLLRAQRARYLADVLPANAVVRATTRGYTRELLFRTDELEIRKRVRPWHTFASWCGVDFEQLKKLYDNTAQQPGLVHAVRGTPTLKGDMYSVDLIPVGQQSCNVSLDTEDDVRLLLHGLLHGLAAIHKVGYVHRDIRWDNFACSPGPPAKRRWFLLDLETCAPADEKPAAAFEPAGWTQETLVNGLYTRASDLYQLGLAVRPRCEGVVESQAGKAFLKAILTPPAKQTRSAEALLQNDWLGCTTKGCRAAGAQPGELGG